MKSRPERGKRTQGENAGVAQLTHLVEPMLAGMTAMRENLMAWVHAQGLYRKRYAPALPSSIA